MKKLAFIALAALAMFSCNKEEVIIENEAQPQTLKYVFSVAEKPSFDADTRAVKKSWEEGDKIYLVYDDVMPTKLEDLTILKYNASGEWTVEQESTTAPKDEGGTLDAIYYGNPDPQKLAVDSQWNAFFFDSMAESGKYMYMVKNNIPYSKKGDTVKASIALEFENYSKETYVQFCITGLEGDWYSEIKDIQHNNNYFGWNSPIWRGKGFSYLDLSGAYPVWGFQLDNRGDEGHYLYCSIEQGADAITITLKKQSGDNKGSYYKTFNKKITGKCAAITFKGPQFGDDGNPTNGWERVGYIGGHAYVEMGDGLKWATMNVGADTPEALGYYFAWGETETKEEYSGKTYTKLSTFDADDGDFNAWIFGINKYQIADGMGPDYAVAWYDSEGVFCGDGKTVLEPEDDAATQNWGSPWRMPKDEEFEKLTNSELFEWTWTDDYNSTGVSGMIVSSKISGYEGNSIFLPSGSSNKYWSSSLMQADTSPDNWATYAARLLSFSSEDTPKTGYIMRYYGHPVRAVAD